MIMVHGSCFVATGHDTNLKGARSTLEDKYRVTVGMFGKGDGCQSKAKIRNPIARYGEEGIETEADPRHAQIVVKEFGLTDAKASRAPGTKGPAPKTDTEEDEHVEKVQLLCGESFVEC